ncbi:hypothetical protein [Xenorhabdus budapestensis]|uniref:Uncharacterized protein n=1 Tax=Xenorhabdus budapestensis TaxID=290110 RepID=A0A2D0ISI0_XENBU|nr:hypothetical protein [Xenorhabdus budapestensis]PHM24815.1 hypothetical protein Xbud_03198 [Xenorhabdus budapestensis]
MTGSVIENMAIAAGHSMQDIYAIAPEIMEQLTRQKPLSYNAFVDQIDKDLNKIISITESGRQHHLDKDEDAITEHIIVQLKQKYPSVHHDAQHGGHCDIYIEVTSSSGDLYKWIMEAKLWKGFEYVYGGLDEQLLGSYAVGGINNCKGGMIFYSKLQSGALYAMREWYQGIEAKGIIINKMREDGLRFDTTHKLNGGTGADFFVNHYCVDLYHSPTADKLEKAEAKAQAKN